METSVLKSSREANCIDGQHSVRIYAHHKSLHQLAGHHLTYVECPQEAVFFYVTVKNSAPTDPEGKAHIYTETNVRIKSEEWRCTGVNFDMFFKKKAGADTASAGKGSSDTAQLATR